MKKAAVPSILAVVVLLVLGVTAEAQQPKKVPRIGYLSSGDPASESTRSEPIRAALRDLGYIEGQNITIEYRYAEWLDVSLTAFAKARLLVKPYPVELMDAHDVSTIVNSAKYDGPECIQPVSDDEIPRVAQLSLL